MSDDTTLNQLTLFAAGFRALTLALLDKGQESRGGNHHFGLNMLESFANYDPDTSSWRTSQRSLFGGWEQFLEAWPRSGMMRNGRCYQQGPLVHPISEIESLCWLTTPTASMSVRSQGYRDSNRKPTPAEVATGKLTNRILPIGKEQAINGPVNPPWIEYLMGFPIGWTDYE